MGCDLGSCKEWYKGFTGSGYGVIYKGRRQKLIHRYIYECAFGEIPKGKVVCHKCDNPKCYKLDHLFLGTQQDNIRDMYLKGREGKSSFNRGEDHVFAKLNEVNVKEIKSLLGKYTYKEIAVKFKVSETTIADIKLKRTWSHIV